jgi:hypothetical protein
MTQQAYYPPQAPPQVQQPYQPQYPQAPQQPYVDPYAHQQAYAPQQAAPQPPPVPLANGSLDAFYAQPTGGGAGISWKGKPDGFTIQGLVPRDVTNGDVTQEVGAPNTQEAGKPQFYRDGRPKFVMAVPLRVPASPEYPEGEARLFVRGQLREELARAMAEAQAQEPAPVANSWLTVTLVQRKQGRGAIPQNIFHVTYTPAGQAPPAINQPATQPVQQYIQPVAQPQYAPAPTGAPSPAPVAQPVAQPVQQPIPQQAQPVQQVQQPVAQVPVAPQPQPAAAAPAAPSDMSPEQQALLAQLQGGQA